MFKNSFIISLFMSTTLFAAPLTCLNSLRSLQGLNPTDLARAYLLKVQGTLTGELDPYIFSEGGLILATLVSDGGSARSFSSPSLTFVILEKDPSHSNTTKIEKAFYKGWNFLLLKRSCVAELKNKDQVHSLSGLVSRLLRIPYTSELKFFSFE